MKGHRRTGSGCFVCRDGTLKCVVAVRRTAKSWRFAPDAHRTRTLCNGGGSTLDGGYVGFERLLLDPVMLLEAVKLLHVHCRSCSRRREDSVEEGRRECLVTRSMSSKQSGSQQRSWGNRVA